MSKVVFSKGTDGLRTKLVQHGDGIQLNEATQLQTTLDVAGVTALTGGLVLGTEAITTAGAASTTVAVSLVTANETDMAITLADGSTTGQVKIFITTADTESWKVTPANTVGAYTKVTCTLAGDTVILMWTGTGWALLSRMSGAAQGATALVGQPIVA